MNVIQIYHMIWSLRTQLQMSGSATLMSFALLELSMRSRYDDYFNASTEDIHILTGLSESTIKTVRKQLIEARIIEYIPGNTRRVISQYRFLIGDNNRPQNKPQSKPQNPVKSASSTLYINNYSLRERESKYSHSKEEVVSIEKLQCLTSDIEWLNRVMFWITTSTGIQLREEDIKAKYEEFLFYLSACGQKTKTESDMKSHFSNWLLKDIKGKKRSTEDADPTVLRTNIISKFKSGEGW